MADRKDLEARGPDRRRFLIGAVAGAGALAELVRVMGDPGPETFNGRSP